MSEIAVFKDVAPYLTQPLVLVGFVLFLAFGVHRALLKAGTIPPLRPRSGSRVLQSLLRYGFVIALVVIVSGFVLEFYRNPRPPTIQQNAEAHGGTAINAAGGARVSVGGEIPTAPASSAATEPGTTTNQRASAPAGGTAVNASDSAEVAVKKP